MYTHMSIHPSSLLLSNINLRSTQRGLSNEKTSSKLFAFSPFSIELSSFSKWFCHLTMTTTSKQHTCCETECTHTTKQKHFTTLHFILPTWLFATQTWLYQSLHSNLNQTFRSSLSGLPPVSGLPMLLQTIPCQQFAVLCQTAVKKRPAEMEHLLQWKTSWNGTSPSVKDQLKWNISFSERPAEMEHLLQWKTSWNGTPSEKLKQSEVFINMGRDALPAGRCWLSIHPDPGQRPYSVKDAYAINVFLLVNLLPGRDFGGRGVLLLRSWHCPVFA